MTWRNAHQYLKKVYLTTKNDSFREALSVALAALRGPTREMVERMRGEWMKTSEYMPIFGCSKCGERNLFRNGDNVFSDFCPACGSPMTDEAVQMVMEKLEALHGE